MRHVRDAPESLQRRGIDAGAGIAASDHMAAGMNTSRCARRPIGKDLRILLDYLGRGNYCARADFSKRGGDDCGVRPREKEFIGCEENSRYYSLINIRLQLREHKFQTGTGQANQQAL